MARLRMLQQGRGGGYRQALAGGAELLDEVLSCVLEDPRWDRQLETRDPYYAALLVHLDVDVTPIVERIRRGPEAHDGSDLWLPLGTLAEMVGRGHGGAHEAVVRLVRDGYSWLECIEALYGVGGSDLVASVIDVCDVEALLKHVDRHDLSPAVRAMPDLWEGWASASHSIRCATNGLADDEGDWLGETGPKPLGWVVPHLSIPSPPPLDVDAPLEDLLALVEDDSMVRPVIDLLCQRRDVATTTALLEVATSGSEKARAVAIGALGAHGCDALLDEAVRYLRARWRVPFEERAITPVHTQWSRYLERLPASATLEHARRWISEDGFISNAAGEILARHGTEDDVDLLVATGAEAMSTGERYYFMRSIVEALGRLGG